MGQYYRWTPDHRAIPAPRAFLNLFGGVAPEEDADDLIEMAIDDALNASALKIQEYVDQDDGGWASHLYDCDEIDRVKEILARFLRAYLTFEVNLRREPTHPAENRFNASAATERIF